jgi:hypothetical protein
VQAHVPAGASSLCFVPTNFVTGSSFSARREKPAVNRRLDAKPNAQRFVVFIAKMDTAGLVLAPNAFNAYFHEWHYAFFCSPATLPLIKNGGPLCK